MSIHSPIQTWDSSAFCTSRAVSDDCPDVYQIINIDTQNKCFEHVQYQCRSHESMHSKNSSRTINPFIQNQRLQANNQSTFTNVIFIHLVLCLNFVTFLPITKTNRKLTRNFIELTPFQTDIQRQPRDEI